MGRVKHVPNQICGSQMRVSYRIGRGLGDQRPLQVLLANRVPVEIGLLLAEGGEGEEEDVYRDSRKRRSVGEWRFGTEHRLGTMSQRFTVSALSRSDGELGEINQLFEGDEPNPSSSDKEGASDLAEDLVKGTLVDLLIDPAIQNPVAAAQCVM